MFFLDHLLAPLWGVIDLVEYIHDQAMKEFKDEATVKRALVALRLRYEMDEIDATVYAKQEAFLLERLRAIRLERLAELEGDDDG